MVYRHVSLVYKCCTHRTHIECVPRVNHSNTSVCTLELFRFLSIFGATSPSVVAAETTTVSPHRNHPNNPVSNPPIADTLTRNAATTATAT